ncbi:MAG: galactitol-1-phosphate 5-dehydrogenase [Micropruina sp.]|uniref:galactitol-1-phosphate 5-dehydrogenase n=1 Tax=Micropruina sp. TaxID=2737536 RepID=UPI0039E431D5
MTGPQELTLTEVSPVCGPDEVLVRVAYCGICGSDVPRYFDGAVHSFPQVLGHEFSGVVETVGAAVTTARPGDRVAVAPLVPCHHCAECLAGRPSLCPNYSFIGSRRQGALADLVAVPAVNLVSLGDLSLRTGALVEPLTVAIHGVERADVLPGEPAAVLGGGVIGLLVVLTLRDKGAGPITVVDVDPRNLAVARQFGAAHAVNALTDDVAGHFARTGAPTLTVETAGVPPTQRQALAITARRGTVVYVGTAHQDLVLSPTVFEHILRHELTVRGSWMSYSAPFPGHEWADAVRILGSGLVDPGVLISHELPLAEAVRGFQAMRSRDEHRLKVMFRVGGEEAGA